MITDERILEEAIRLVREGVSVTLPVNGNSMLPFIIGGRESVILKRAGLVDEGDVVLAWVEGCRYVVHRIIRIDGNHITLMGDGNIVGTEHCTVGDIKAIVTHVVDANGKIHDINNKWRRRAAKVWFWIRPIRRYILAIYRRL
jgi:hypothetical protein